MRRSARLAAWVAALLLTAGHAQTPSQQAICDADSQHLRCAALVQEFTNKTLLNGPASPFDEPDPFEDIDAFVQRYRARAVRDFLTGTLKQQTARAAQAALQTISTTASAVQTGSPSPSSGASTDLTTKPVLTDFLSIAAESGAFADTLNSTGVTLSGNALGITKYFSGTHPVFDRWNSAAADQLQPWNVSVALNLTQTGNTTAPVTGAASPTTPGIASVFIPNNNASFQSFTASYVLYRPYNPQNTDFLREWTAALTSSQDAVNAAVSNISIALNSFVGKDADVAIYADPRYQPVHQAWLGAAKPAEQVGDNASFARFVAAYSAYEDFFYEYFTATPDGPKNLLALAQAVDAYDQATYAVLNKARTQLATATYTFTAAAQKPATHTLKAIYAATF